MFIETVPNRGSPPAVLLRESYRDERGKSRKRTLASLSKLPPHVVEGVKALLKGGCVIGAGDDGLRIERSPPRGHVAAGLGQVRKLALDAATACGSLGQVLGLRRVGEQEVYEALDWLLAQRRRVETALARRHSTDGTLALYDVSSSYLEGRKCPLTRFGYSQDKRPDRPQIVHGLLCTGDGPPVAVEMFEGNTADPMTLSAQVAKLKERCGLKRIVLVGDRGMITTARIEEDPKPVGLDWISCLRAPRIQELAGDDGPLQLSLFGERERAEINAPRFPGERLIVCRNPLLFHDTESAVARAERSSPVAKTAPSKAVRTKKATKRSQAGLPVMGFAELIAHLGTLAANTVRARLQGDHSFTLHTRKTHLQEAAFELLRIDPARVQ